MTQRVARPMKFAAFISIILSVAVLFVACQGAVGPAGADGKDGRDGTDGTDGAAGKDAFQALELKPKSPFVVISDTTDADGATVPGAAQTIDLAEYVRGSAERTYGTPTSDLDTAQVFDASIEGSMLTIAPKATQSDTATEAYAVETFTVEVSDGGESNPVKLAVPVRRNRKPTAPASDATGTVGTQAPDTAPSAVRACSVHDGAGANECYVELTFGDLDSSEITTSEEKLSFTATSSDTAKVEVVSVANAPGANPGDPAQVLVARLVVKGIASTWDSAADSPDHDPVEVIVVATDAGGETVRGKAQISVDGAPTVKQAIPGGAVSATQLTYTIANVAGFFEDPESGTGMTFAAVSGNTNAATVTVGSDGANLVVTRNAPGTAEITVTATEASSSDDPQQSVKATFTVTAS